MHKYATATALPIALNITMLALAVSASLTPANARSIVCGNYGAAGIYCHCSKQCVRDAIRDHAPVSRMFDDKKYQACEAKCVNAAEAARH